MSSPKSSRPSIAINASQMPSAAVVVDGEDSLLVDCPLLVSREVEGISEPARMEI